VKVRRFAACRERSNNSRDLARDAAIRRAKHVNAHKLFHFIVLLVQELINLSVKKTFIFIIGNS
jgi:hypothetical protein